MAIETHESGVTITGDDIGRYRRLVLRSALKLEINGLRMTRGRTVYSIIKKEFGLKGNKQLVLEQFEDLLRTRQELDDK
jgi:hypothetical protein